MLTNEQILSAIEAAEASAFGPKTSEIASDRADALDRYMGKPYGDEQAGRSQVVSRDVSDVVEGVTANVLKPFVGGDRVVIFNPRGPEDEPAAEQETDYVNFVVMERNNGFVVLNAAVKDALLLRNGYVKCGWTKRDDVTIEKYEGQSDEELALLMRDEAIEVFEHSEYPDPFAQGAAMMLQGQPQPQMPGVPGQGMGPEVPQQMPMLHDVRVRRKQPTEYVEIMPVPPDELLVSQRTTEPSLQGSDFIQHRPRKTLSELREMGYDVPDDISDDEDPTDVEDYARSIFSTETDQDDPTSNAARRVVTFKETWMRIDKDGDGIAELRRICSVGKTLLADEEADLIPVACFTPVLMPHRHLGISVYDLIKDIAQIKTAMLRSHLDNRYLQNNAEKVININAIENVDDFLTSRPGGIKRVIGNPAEAVMPLVVPDTGSGALMTLEYLDSIRENRTGYTKAAEGMKSGSLATGTLGELQQQVSQSATRLEMIARTIAETGMRDLFRITHALTLKHSSRAEKIRLRNNWVEINPREWVRRTDLSISVGLGSTTGPQQMQNLMMIGQAQQQAMPLGIVQPENVYNVLSKLATAAGFKNPEEFFTKPQPGQPPPENKDPLVQAEEVKGQIALQKAQMEQQAEMPKAQMEVEKAKAIAEIDANAKIQIATITARIEAETDLQKAQIEAGIREQEAQLSHERESALGMERVKNEGKPAVRVGSEQSDQMMAEASQHVMSQSDAMAQAIAALTTIVGDMKEAIANPRPRKIIRGPDGRAAGVE